FDRRIGDRRTLESIAQCLVIELDATRAPIEGSVHRVPVVDQLAFVHGHLRRSLPSSLRLPAIYPCVSPIPRSIEGMPRQSPVIDLWASEPIARARATLRARDADIVASQITVS